MSTDDDATLSVTGTGHVDDGGHAGTFSFGTATGALAVVTAVLVAVTALTAVETGNASVGIGLVVAAILTVGSAATLELWARLDS